MSVVINGTTGITSPSPFVLEGSTSGTITVAAPAIAGTNTQTLVATTGTLAPIVSATAQTAPFAVTTYAEFSSIPSWVKRITVVIDGLSGSGTSSFIVQLGDSGGIENTNYSSTVTAVAGTSSGTAFTGGFGIVVSPSAGSSYTGQVIINLLSSTSNMWSYSSAMTAGSTTLQTGGGGKTLSATLDRIRVTTNNGTDTFDAGTINILYE
jgi:hypothetical protein